jgi:hypothetical protein
MTITSACYVLVLASLAVCHRNHVVHSDPESIGQLTKNVNRAAVAACLDFYDLNPVNAGGAGERG